MLLFICMLFAAGLARCAPAASASARAAHRRSTSTDLAERLELARLEELFEVYSLRHARCVEDEASACSYVLVTTNTVRGGLGNRLPSLVTGFLLALLTRRTLMLDFEMYDEFFAHPLDFGWQRHAARLAERGQNLTYAAFEEQLPASNAYAAADFATAAFANTSVLHIVQDRDWQGAVLAGNPAYRSFFREYFPTGSVFHPLAAFLLRPSDSLRARAHAHMRRHFTAHMVGIQIRLLKGGEGIYASWAPAPSIEAYCAVAMSLAASYGPTAAVRYFVSADSPTAYAEVGTIGNPNGKACRR